MSQEEVTGKTIDILSRFIKKTPLNVKLLSKPPFRYLHDLIIETIRLTGVFEGLYLQSELSHENYKDKDSKIAFLQKIIDGLKLATGAELKVNPLKIVAGLEFQETNYMLQLLGKVDTVGAVETLTGRSTVSTQAKASQNSSPAPVSISHKDEIAPAVASDIASSAKREVVRQPSPQIDPPQEIRQVEGISMMAQTLTRPMTARLPPPKPKKEIETESEFLHVPAIPRDAPEEDDNEFLINVLEQSQSHFTDTKVDSSEKDLHGGLVSKILQTKKELQGIPDDSEVRSLKDTLPVGIKEINALKDSIQLLCQSTHPLGKTMDYMQEDVDAMNKEMDIWKKEGENFEYKLNEQERLEMDSIKPLEESLSKIEASIQEQLAKMSALKGEILMNDAHIEKMLKGIASAN